MSKEIVKKITISIGGTEVEVTPKQARELHNVLAELLGLEAKETIVIHEWYPRYWCYPAYPAYPTTDPTYPTTDPTWYTSTAGSSGVFNTETGEAKLLIN